MRRCGVRWTGSRPGSPVTSARADLAATALAAQLEAGVVLAQSVWSFNNLASIQRGFLDGMTDPASRQTVQAGLQRNLAQSEAAMDS